MHKQNNMTMKEERICNRKAVTILVMASIISITAAFLAVIFIPNYDQPFIKMMYFVLGVNMFIAFDHFVMTGIFTKAEIKKGNVAHAIYLLAVAVVLHGAFSMF